MLLCRRPLEESCLLSSSYLAESLWLLCITEARSSFNYCNSNCGNEQKLTLSSCVSVLLLCPAIHAEKGSAESYDQVTWCSKTTCGKGERRVDLEREPGMGPCQC